MCFTGRLFQVTDVLLAEVLPDGSIRWWESPPIPWDSVPSYKPVKILGGLMFEPGRRSRHKHRDYSPGFDDWIRALEDTS